MIRGMTLFMDPFFCSLSFLLSLMDDSSTSQRIVGILLPYTYCSAPLLFLQYFFPLPFLHDFFLSFFSLDFSLPLLLFMIRSAQLNLFRGVARPSPVATPFPTSPCMYHSTYLQVVSCVVVQANHIP